MKDFKSIKMLIAVKESVLNKYETFFNCYS